MSKDAKWKKRWENYISQAAALEQVISAKTACLLTRLLLYRKHAANNYIDMAGSA